MDEYEYDEGSDIDNWETEQVFRDNEGEDAEEEMPTVAAAWRRHWADRDSAELAKAEAEATTVPPEVDPPEVDPPEVDPPEVDPPDKFLADLLAIMENIRK